MDTGEPRDRVPTAVVALGGHAFIHPGERGTCDEHERNARDICRPLMTLVERGYNLVITHGNGPQVGDLLEQAELTRDRVPPLRLDVLVAQTQGSLGYYLQQALVSELRRRKLRRYVVTVVTQVLVDASDPAFDNPSKPVGPFLTREQAESRRERFGWDIAEEVGRGWRRVVASPRPVEVIQRDMVREAVHAGQLVIAAGGGGIPVHEPGEPGDLEGIEAVIDKDLTSSLLATDVCAELLIILTAVECVYLDFATPAQRPLGAVTLAECERLIDSGRFPPGSMGPKLEAMYGFLQRGGKRGLITSPARLAEALDGAAGTHCIGRS
jgi:carbamate kinase